MLEQVPNLPNVNTREPSMCHGDDTMKNMGIVHKGGLGEDKGVHNMRYDLCLERGKAQVNVCLIEEAAGEKNKRL